MKLLTALYVLVLTTGASWAESQRDQNRNKEWKIQSSPELLRNVRR